MNWSSHTWTLSKGGHGPFSLRLRIETPRVIRLLVCLLAAFQSHFILSNNGLPVEDKERHNLVFIPVFKVLSDVSLKSGQASKSGKKRFVSRGGIKEMAEIISRIDRYRTAFKLGDAMVPV